MYALLLTLTIYTQVPLSTGDLRAWIIKNVVPLILCVLGVIIMATAGKGQTSRVMNTGLIVLVGIIFIAGGALIYKFGNNIATVTFG